MKAIARRLRRLEDHFGAADREPQLLLFVYRAGQQATLDRDRLVEIVRESGFMPTGACGVLTLGDIPQALNAAETELYVREHAAEICGNRRGY